MRDDIAVVLAGPRNPLNIGAAARAMSNFGFMDLRLVLPYEVAFREARSAVGASRVLHEAREYASLAEALRDCTLVAGTTSVGPRQLTHPLQRLEAAAPLIRSHAAGGGRVALVFGSEKFGLNNDEMSYCHWLLRIPSREEHGSMNLGQAVAVCLYELIREEGVAPAASRYRMANAEDLERSEELLFEALRISGYLKQPVDASTERKIRRMLRRLPVPARDAEMWQGMLRQILWKLRGGRVVN